MKVQMRFFFMAFGIQRLAEFGGYIRVCVALCCDMISFFGQYKRIVYISSAL